MLDSLQPYIFVYYIEDQQMFLNEFKVLENIAFSRTANEEHVIDLHLGLC